MSLKSILFFIKIFLRNIHNGKISFKKVKALIFNFLFAILKIPRILYGPQAIWVEAANFCNLYCKACWVPSLSNKLTPKAMHFGMFKGLIDEINDTLIMVMLQMSGESFLNTGILEMMSYAHKKRTIVWISTNGSFLTPDDWGEKIVKTGIDTMYFSISGITQQDYQIYHRKGNLSYVIDNIKKIQNAKKSLNSKTPYLFFRMLIINQTGVSIKKVRKFAKELGVGLHVRYVHLNYVFDGLEDPHKTKIHITCSGRPEKLKNHCLGLWLAPAVQSNGNVLPCCLNQLGVPTFGNVNKIRFDQIWRGEGFNNFRRSMLFDRKNLGGCAYCDNSIGFKDKFSKENKIIHVSFRSD